MAYTTKTCRKQGTIKGIQTIFLVQNVLVRMPIFLEIFLVIASIWFFHVRFSSIVTLKSFVELTLSKDTSSNHIYSLLSSIFIFTVWKFQNIFIGNMITFRVYINTLISLSICGVPNIIKLVPLAFTDNWFV